MKMKQKKRKLQTLIMKNYIIFTVVYLLCFFLFIGFSVYFFGFLQHRENNKWEQFLVADLTEKPYDQIDFSKLKSIHGSIEILDDSLTVIYRVGEIDHSKSSYTDQELFDLLQTQFDHNKISKVGITTFDLTLPTKSPNDQSDCVLIYQTFTDHNGKWHLCLERLPKNYIETIPVRVTSPANNTIIVLSGILVLIGGLILLILTLKLFSKRISNRIGKPLGKLTNGLNEITQGNYKERLSFEAENELSEMKDAFNYMAAELQQAEEEKRHYEKERQMLFSNIAHDIKTPLTTILGYTKALSEGLVKEEEIPDYLDGIQQKSLHVNELIQFLLDFTKLENDAYQLKIENTDLLEFIRKIIAENFKLLEQNNMELEIDMAEDTKLNCHFDPLQLKRAFSNLLVNAVNHNPPNTTILISVTQNDTNHSVIIDVADNGAIIPDDIKQDLFEPFVLGDRSRSSKNGSGLGLSISRRIVEKHGGTLTLMESGIPDGYTKCFRIELPI